MKLIRYTALLIVAVALYNFVTSYISILDAFHTPGFGR